MQLGQKKSDVVVDRVHFYFSVVRIQNRVVDHIDPFSILPDTSGIDDYEPRPMDVELAMSMPDHVTPRNFNRSIRENRPSVDGMQALEYAEAAPGRKSCNQVFA